MRSSHSVSDELPGRQPPQSLYVAARREARVHKWLASERHGYDMGSAAIAQWNDLYWNTYCREKRLEHLLGDQLWQEFAEQEFGRLADLQHCTSQTIATLLKYYRKGWENLHFVQWIQDTWPDRHQPEVQDEINRIMDLLAEIDTNITRFDPPEEEETDDE